MFPLLCVLYVFSLPKMAGLYTHQPEICFRSCINPTLKFVAFQVFAFPLLSICIPLHSTLPCFLPHLVKIHLLDHGEEYTMTFPNTYIRSLLTYPWLELGGRSTISCAQTGYSANFDFHCKVYTAALSEHLAKLVIPKLKQFPQAFDLCILYYSGWLTQFFLLLFCSHSMVEGNTKSHVRSG